MRGSGIKSGKKLEENVVDLINVYKLHTNFGFFIIHR